MILSKYQQQGGRHSEFSAIKNVLSYQGIVEPKSGRPLSEAMLFGTGSGIGASYFNFLYEGYPPTLSINPTGRYKAKYGEVMERTVSRLGLKPMVKSTKSADAAWKFVKTSIDQGLPVLVQVLQQLSIYPRQGYEQYAEHGLVVFGYDEAEGVVHIGDTSARPHQLPIDIFLEARSSFAPLKNWGMTVAEGEVDIARAIKSGIQSAMRDFLDPPTPKSNFGLNALQKWAELLESKSKRGWAAVFAPGPDLYRALASVYAQIELLAGGDGGMRGLYASFLEESSQLLGLPDLKGAAEAYRRLAVLWSGLAEAALPETVPALAETRRLMQQKRAVYQERGSGALAELQRVNGQQADLDAQMADSFPMTETAVAALLGELSDRVRLVAEAEEAAARSLQNVADSLPG